MTMLRAPSKLLSKSRFTQWYEIQKRSFVRAADGTGQETFTTKKVRLSIQPIDKANDELKSYSSGEREQDKFTFFTRELLGPGDLIFFDNSWFRVTKPNYRKAYGFTDGEATRYDGPSGPSSNGFTIT